MDLFEVHSVLLMELNCCPRHCPGRRPRFPASRPSVWAARPGPSWAGCSAPGTARACALGSSAPSTPDSSDLPCAHSSEPARSAQRDETFRTKDALWQRGYRRAFGPGPTQTHQRHSLESADQHVMSRVLQHVRHQWATRRIWPKFRFQNWNNWTLNN